MLLKLDLSKYLYLFFIVLMLFTNLLKPIIVSVILIIYFVFRIWRYKKFSFNQILIYLIFESVPLSFFSILGYTTDIFPISWFHLLIILHFFILLFSTKLRKTTFILFFLFSMYNFLYLFENISFISGLKQLFVIILFLIIFFITDAIEKKSIKSLNFIDLENIYILGTLAIAIQVILQYIFYNYYSIQLGYLTLMGSNRLALGATMGDFSFTSIYIGTGIALMIINFFESNIAISKIIFFVPIMLLGLVTTTARTGLYSLVLVLILYYLFNLRTLNWRSFFSILITPVLFVRIFEIVLLKRGKQSLLSSSGRVQNYIDALQIFSSNPKNILVGIGLGKEEIISRGLSFIPHNFIIQFLLQLGILGLIFIFLVFLNYYYYDFSHSGIIKWIILYIVISSMFVPDIFSSRFLSVVLVLATIEKCKGYNYE